MVEWLFLKVPWGCLRFVIVVFPDHTHLLFLKKWCNNTLKQELSTAKTYKRNLLNNEKSVFDRQSHNASESMAQ